MLSANGSVSTSEVGSDGFSDWLQSDLGDDFEDLSDDFDDDLGEAGTETESSPAFGFILEATVATEREFCCLKFDCIVGLDLFNEMDALG